MNGDNAPSSDPQQSEQEPMPTVSDRIDDRSVDASPHEVPDVDELESRLRDVEEAMGQLQSAELETAERSIEALEHRITGRPD